MKKAHIYAIPAIGAALIAVLAQISVPIGPVPFTLQNFAIGLIATVFRPREAVLSVGLYLLLGAIGLPVFAGGGAGFHVLVGPSAGYLWFDLLYAGITSYLIHKNSSYVRIFIANLLGDSLVFVGGILSLHFLAGMPFDKALAVGVLPFIIPDLAKIIAISFVGKPLLKRLSKESNYSI
ncbi:biotin transporter BioY [Streptococcus infantis]|uniref:biotin transporter BioY n=1 Tax=Streptococcus infantis TaxID=68892 RepID=UPI001CBC05CB|nr:biotin transporter BioY [Streptococcus infantis]MBZ2110811.1 biotin transporter BioY [Streptococcus infantis]MBZ2113254.1 biotin transporter BioY [Streptococcus infantis]MBZ2118363.1 biotin transporter BioY [Streptococcus infantis]